MSQTSGTLELALAYLARGWSIIPIHRGTKRPCVEWREFCRRLPTEQEVRSWWTQWPDANIALICGKISGLVAVDVDPRHGGKVEPILKEWPTALISKTGGGGWHLFYTNPPGVTVQNRTNIRPGVDIRGEGGYVVLPGSTHESGKVYEWKRDDQPEPCPKWVYERLEETHVPAADNWLSDTLRGVPKGQRNEAMTRLAGYLISKQIPRDVVLEMLLLWRTRVEEPQTLSDDEIERTVSHAHRNYRRGDAADTKMALPLRFHLWALQHHTDTVRWLVEDWWPQSSVGLAVSEPGLYKTWMLFDLAVSVATGKPFLGQYPVQQQGPAIVVQQEDYSVDITARLSRIAESKMPSKHGFKDESWYGNVLNPDLYIYPNRDFRFDSPDLDQWCDDAVAKVEQETGRRPVLITIDPLYATVDVDDYLAKAVPHMSRVKDWRDKHGVAVIIAHHTRKTQTGDWSRLDTYGSVFIDAFLESGWQFRKPKNGMDGDLVIIRHHKRTGNPPPLLMKFDIDNYTAELSEVGDEDEQDTGNLEHDVFELLLRKGPLSRYGIRQALDVHDRKVQKALDALAKAGRAKLRGKKWAALDQPEVTFD